MISLRVRNRLPLLAVLVMCASLLGAACGNDVTRPGEGRVKERWFQPQVNGYPNSAPLVAGPVVYFAEGGGFVTSRDAATGASNWRTPIGQSIYTAVSDVGGENFILRKGTVVAAVQFHVTGLDAASGARLWQYDPPLDTIEDPSPRPGLVFRTRLAADDNNVFVPAWGATVSALDARTGQTRWIWRVQPNISFRSGASGATLSGDTVFISVWHSLNQSGTRAEAWIVALDRLTGLELWRVVLPREASGTMINCAPRVWNDLVIVTLTSGDVFAVNRHDQQIAWHVPTQLPQSGLGTALITSPEVSNDIVYANGSDQMLHAYHAADGSEIWRSPASQFTNDMLVTDKFIYATDGASIYIFDKKSGSRFAALPHPRKSPNYVFSSGQAADAGSVFANISDAAWSFKEP